MSCSKFRLYFHLWLKAKLLGSSLMLEMVSLIAFQFLMVFLFMTRLRD